SIPAGRVTRSLLEIGGAPVRARPAQDSPAIIDVEVEGLTVAIHVIAALAPPIGHVPGAKVGSGRSYAPAPEVHPRAHGDVLAAVQRDEHAQAATAERVARQLGSELCGAQRRLLQLIRRGAPRRRCTEGT